MHIIQRTEIESLVNIEAAIPKLEAAYRALSEGRVTMPPVGHITFPKFDADCHLKYGHIEGDDFFVIKVATGFPLNQQRNLPNGNGMLLVLSAETGTVKALLHDEMFLTDFRTGLSGAITSHLLARQNARHILIVGTGIQAKMQIKAHAAKFKQQLVFSIWGRSREKAKALADEMSKKYAVRHVVSLASACRQADVIVTTTASKEPIINADWISLGTHITAVGADAQGKQELENALFSKADLIAVDSKSQCIDHGEIEAAVRQGILEIKAIVEVGAILGSPNLGRKCDDQITIADLTGIAAHDITMAGIILQSLVD